MNIVILYTCTSEILETLFIVYCNLFKSLYVYQMPVKNECSFDLDLFISNTGSAT